MEPSDAVSDRAVVERVLDGDVRAFSLLVDRYYDRYARYAVRMLGDERDAEEALQDTFVRAYRSLGRYEEREQFGRWLLRILVNRCRTAAARRRVRERVVLPGSSALPVHPVSDRAYEASEWRDEVTRALAQLPVEQREAFVMKHVEELSYEEMRELTGTSVPALKMRVRRACIRLRELLQEVPSA